MKKKGPRIGHLKTTTFDDDELFREIFAMTLFDDFCKTSGSVVNQQIVKKFHSKRRFWTEARLLHRCIVEGREGRLRGIIRTKQARRGRHTV